MLIEVSVYQANIILVLIMDVCVCTQNKMSTHTKICNCLIN